MGKVLQNVFKTVVNNISQYLTPLVESGLEVSHFIPEPIKFSEVKKLSDGINKNWLEETLKEIKTKLTIKLYWLNIQRKVSL